MQRQRMPEEMSNGSECTQLLQLLARNPSAALKKLKFSSPDEERSSRVHTYKGRRPKLCQNVTKDCRVPAPTRPVQIYYCLSPKMSYSRTTADNQRTKSKKLNTETLLSYEDIELKSKCVDKLGNFNFEALLPAIYWKSEKNGMVCDH